jgi:hypothetical protein
VVVHLFEQTLAGSAHGMTGWAAVVSRVEKGRQLFRCEAELDGVSDEQQLCDRVSGVVPKASGGSRGLGKHADALVVSDQIGAHARAASGLTDSKRCSCHAVSYNLE